MSRGISFTVTDIEHRLITADAHAKGLTASAYAKNCLMTHINRSPSKGIFAVLEQELAALREKTSGHPAKSGSQSNTKPVTTPE